MRQPKYRKHGSRDLGLVEFKGKRYTFPGKFNSVESVDAYSKFLREHVYAERPSAMPAELPIQVKSVGDLVLMFLDDADRRYEGSSDSEYGNLRASLLPLAAEFGDVPVADFGPLKLRAYRTFLAKGGNARSYVNWQISRVRRCFRWAVSQEMVPIGIYDALCTVEGLKVGQSEARETASRKPVPWADVKATLPFLTEPVANIVRCQWFIGCRCKSLCNAKPGQFDRTQQPWLWRPQHKRESFGVELVLPIGPKAQAILGPIIDEKRQDEFLFSPRDIRPNRRYRKSYSTRSIGQAIERAVAKVNEVRDEKNKLPLWTPHQLRHAKGHATRKVYGIEAAQAILGHESLESTQIYSARRLELAKKVARETG